MTDPSTAPATKADIKMLMDQIGTYYSQTDSRLAAIDERFDEMGERFGQQFTDTNNLFDLAVETIRHDLAGANSDRIAGVENRVHHIEKHLRLIAD